MACFFLLLCWVLLFFANSRLDEAIAKGYQSQLRSTSTDTAASLVRVLGNPPVVWGYLGSFFALKALEPLTKRHFLLDLTEKMARISFVSLPPLLLSRVVLGGTRPNVEEPHSAWHPFQNLHYVSVSGHSFFGALPFLAIASLTDSLWLKSFCFVASTLTGLSRLNDNKHYMSQVILGWAFAYMGFFAVEKTFSRVTPEVHASPSEIALGFNYSF